jgi:hypothetical protein
MSQVLQVPDELYQALARYAAQRQQSLEEALASYWRPPRHKRLQAQPVPPRASLRHHRPSLAKLNIAIPGRAFMACSKSTHPMRSSGMTTSKAKRPWSGMMTTPNRRSAVFIDTSG